MGTAATAPPVAPARVDCYQAGAMLGLAPSTVRMWARRGWITRVNPGPPGRNPGYLGRALYDPADVLRHARDRLDG